MSDVLTHEVDQPGVRQSDWQRRKTILEITEEVAREHGLSGAALTALSTTIEIARQEAYAKCAEAGYTQTQIANRFSGRHHTCVTKALQRRVKSLAAECADEASV